MLGKHFLIFISIFVAPFNNKDVQSKRIRRIVGGVPADVATSDEPVVYLRYAKRSATIRGILDFPHYVFRGIRYAYAPVGRDRFQRPRQYFLNGGYNASTFPPPCMQPKPGKDVVIGSEDCLFLNVFTPNLPDSTEGLPVVVWIHGGGFRYGSASQYGVRHLVGKQLVVITIQYRLGTLGFLSSGTPELPGNAALFDMALAVQWVRNYIVFFGGNPNKIVVMGHGTGASSALLLTLSNIAKGSISAVVAMSGSAISHWAIDNSPSQTVKDIAEYHGCTTRSVLPLVRCLQQVSAQSIIRIDSCLELSRLETRGFISGLSGLLGSSPVKEGVNDGRSLPAAVQREPLDDLYYGRQRNIPLLTGITKDETKAAVHGQYKEEIVSKWGKIPHFLDEVLIQNLQSLIGLGTIDKKDNQTTTLWNIMEPLQFQTYIQASTDNVKQALEKISEATGDALFNLPAFLTADLWSKQGANTYLYRFEHCGNGKKGHTFLKGMPLVGNQTENENLTETVSHGDDLSYLFDPLDIYGSELKEDMNLTQEDEKVREIYTQMISNFAHSGRISVDNAIIPSFSIKQNNFLQISSKPKVSNNFRYCEMALWAGLTERLQNTTCKFLDLFKSNIENAKSVFFDSIHPTNAQKHVSKVVNAISDPISLFNVKKSESTRAFPWLG